MVVYTDGSCRKNKRGGWAFVAIYGKKIVDRCGTIENATSNRCELLAVIQAVKFLGNRKATIYSDSRYVVDNFLRNIGYWKSKDWKTKDGPLIQHSDLWKELSELKLKHQDFKLVWIKGREPSEHRHWNQWADSLARLASE